MLWGMFRVNRSQLTLMSFILDHCFLSLILTTTSGASFCRCRNTPSRNSWTLEVWLLTPKNALQNLPWQVTSRVPRSITYSDVVRRADSTWRKSKVPGVIQISYNTDSRSQLSVKSSFAYALSQISAVNTVKFKVFNIKAQIKTACTGFTDI